MKQNNKQQTQAHKRSQKCEVISVSSAFASRMADSLSQVDWETLVSLQGGQGKVPAAC